MCKAIVQALFYCTFSILFRFSAQHGRDAAVYCLRFVGIFKLQPVSGIAAVKLPSTSPANAACRPEMLRAVWGEALGPWISK